MFEILMGNWQKARGEICLISLASRCSSPYTQPQHCSHLNVLSRPSFATDFAVNQDCPACIRPPPS